LLRTAIGVTAVIQGAVYVDDFDTLTLATSVVVLLAILGGASLLFGFLTPLAGIVVALGAIGIALSWLPRPALNLLDAALPAILVVIVSAAVAFLGPGALSVDARLFGRREIIIPHTPRSQRP
jgi:uncharacterized membrane protein YphA (DoxX/SURF4 family)